MNPDRSPSSVEKRVDEACDRFEAAWRAKQFPRIEDILANVVIEERRQFLRNLLLLEVELRRSDGENPAPKDYLERFPPDHSLIQSVFAVPSTLNDDKPRAEPDDRKDSEESHRPPVSIGRYQVRRRVGKGAYGYVYLAHDSVMDRDVAIKIPSPRLLRTNQAREEFLKEVRSVARLNHEGIVRAHDFGQQDDGSCYIVYEYVEGLTLAERIEQNPPSYEESARIVARVAEALHFAHLEGLVHRDIKPGNILLDSSGRPRVADFGLAVREEDLPTQRGHRAGTLPYMSPEQVRREGHLLDGRTDIYSLGVVLYELLCGRRPFEAPTDDGLIDQILNREAKPPRQIRNSIPRELESVCLKALSKRIHDRYSTAKDMAEEALQVAEAFKKPKNESALEDNLEEIGRRMASADERELRRLLRLLPEIGDAACVPLVFRHLVHPSEPVRDQARKVVHALGWKKVSAAIEDLANCGGAVDMGVVLDGLAAFEAHAQIVELLDRLVVIVKDDLRNRTILLLERKRLGLELNAVAALFREIHSPYRIVKALGQGLFAAAYLARVDGTDLEVVVRVLRPEFAGQPHVRVQFLDLSKKALRVVHENLALTREARAFPDRNIYFAVRDYVNGVTLQKLLEGGKRFERVQIVRLLRQLLLALGAVHRNGMWHGGVKPSNVFVCGEDRVVLGDPSLPVQCIGVALDRLAYDYRYFAPENFSAGAAPGPHADFYSLGCVAYELACGQPPFVSDNYLALAARHLHEAVPPPSTRHSRLGPEADQLILKLLARSPADRYTRSEDIGLALDWLEALWLTSGPLAHTPTRPLLDDASLARFEDAQSIFQFGASPSRIESGAVHESDDADESGEETRSGNADDLGDEDFVPRESAQVMPTRVGLYEILELVGRGGMGVVYKARHVELDRVVALKTLVRGRHTERNQVARFQKEARAAARLQHPNIVQIYDIIEHEGFTYLALEYVGGGSLSKQPPAESPKQVFAVVETVAKLAHAVQHAHEQGIVHRDLKPSNILLTEDGQPKIADFGLAKLLEPSASELESTALGTIMGTPAYMAPEQAAGNIGEIGPTTDIYGLGAILYALLTGRPPFKGQSLMETLNQLATQQPEPPRTLNPSVDQSLNLICLKCLEKDPRKRYESAKKLAEDLERWLQGGPTSTSPETTFRRLLAWVRRSLDGLYPFRKRARRPIT